MNNKISMGKKLMQCAVFILFLPLFSVSCTNEPELPTADEAKAEIMEKVKAANDKWSSGDPMGFLEVAAQDVTWIDDLAAQNRVSSYEALAEYLKAFKGQIPPHKYELIDPVFQLYDDIVILTYRYQGTFEGEPLSPWKITSVYRFADGEWLSVHENWSLIKPPSE